MGSFEFRLVPFTRGWAQIIEDWQKLFHLCSTICIFYHPLFIEAARSLPQNDQPTHLLLGRQDGRVILGLPVQVLDRAWGFREIRLFEGGSLGFDHLEPLDLTLDYQATKVLLRTLDRWGICTISVRNASSRFANLLMSESNNFSILFKRPVFRCPFLVLPDGKEALLASLSSKFRSNIRYAWRKADKAGIHFRSFTGGDTSRSLDLALECLMDLHAERAETIGRRTNFLTPTSRSFHTRLCRLASKEPGLVWFYEAVHQGRVIASLYGFRLGQRFYFLQSGFAPEYGRYSPGVLLLYYTLARLIADDVKIFDFLRGADSYKFKWTKSWDQNYLIFAGHSVMGLLAVNWLRWQRAIHRYGRWQGTRQWLGGRD